MKIILSFLLLAFAISVTCSLAIDSKCSGDQQVLLLNIIKESFPFDASSSSKLVSWNSSTDCCSWLGITCSTDGRVIGLDISREPGLGGIVNSSSLFHLQHLQSLNLSGNFLGRGSQQIPSAIGHLKNLKYLDLSSNEYFGQIPIEISYLTRLVVLDFSLNNQLIVKSPSLYMLVQNLTELIELDLDSVRISPQESNWGLAISSSLPNLRVLRMTGCSLSGPIHDSLAKLQSLSVVQLGSNDIIGPVPVFFANFSNLTILGLSHCSFQGLFPKEIFQLPSLQSIDLSYNPELHGSLPEFPENGSLRSLFLAGSNFSGSLPNSIGNLAMLSIVQITWCSFTGSLPKSMANLTQLITLEMSHNNFEGSIPCFSRAKNLNRIDLSSNGLTGSINCTTWGNLSNLSFLDLSDNMLGGNIPSSLFSLTSLNLLQISNNQFSGQIPELSSDSSYSMEYLDFQSNNLEGRIPISIFNFRGLNVLDLSSNNFSGSFPLDGFQHQKNLFYLSLSHNNIFLSYDARNFSYSSFPHFVSLKLVSVNLRTFPSFLRNQSQLYDLDLSDNQIHGEVPNWIWNLQSIRSLNLSYNTLDALQASSVSNLTTLQLLDLHANKFQGQIPYVSSSIAYYLDYSRNCFNSNIPTTIGDMLQSTAFISLSSNNLHGVIPESICKARFLEVLDLSNNSLSGTVPQCVTAMTTLGVLNLRRNNLTEIGMLSKTSSLQTLDISENHIQSQFLKSLVYCTKLEVLNLGRNQITYRFPCFLKKISALRVLILRSNQFYGDIGCLETNGTWPMLQIIDLANNKFSGEIPAKALTTWHAMTAKYDTPSKPNHLQFQDGLEDLIYQDTVTVFNKGVKLELVKILTVFTLIDFSCNKFDGSIPKEIGELKRLYALNLSNNAFSGAIPVSLSNLGQLESLDLSKNNLSGQIPPQLTMLTFLSFLNLSYNQLVGRIPGSNQFSTFSEDSFKGNKGLFGPPLTKDDIPGSSPPPSISNFHPNTRDQVDWDIISIEVGFIFGFGVAIGSPLFCKRWRQRYYGTMYKIILRIFPRLEERIFA